MSSRDGTRERIRQAAEALFCEAGFDAVSIADIAARAGVGKPLVFYHFDSKEALFDAVLEGYYTAHREALEGALSPEGDVRARMHALARAYLRFMASNARYARLVQAQLSHPETHPLVEKSFAPLYAFVERALDGAAPRSGPTSARQLFVTFSGAVINWCTYAPLLARVWGDDPLSPSLLDEREAHLAFLVDALLDAMGVSGRSSAAHGAARTPARKARSAPPRAPRKPGKAPRS